MIVYVVANDAGIKKNEIIDISILRLRIQKIQHNVPDIHVHKTNIFQENMLKLANKP